MEDRDTKGGIYEYMLGKLATAGTSGQFRTPRDVMVDPACGTCGFPVAVGEDLREHFNHGLFHGFDFDTKMLRIGAMNMLLHGVENPDVSYRDSLSEDGAEEQDKYTLILANPPFAGSLDYESTSGKLQRVVKTKKTELLFMALFLQLLKPGGRAAVIVPDGVLFGSSKAHRSLRQQLVEEHCLEGVVSLPSGVFRPYAGVSTAILLFTKTGRGGTDFVWLHDMTADGWSLDDKRNPLLPLEKLGPAPKVALAEGEHDKNNLPDCLARRWRQRKDAERERERTAQSFCVPKAEIAEQGYDLSLNRYKELIHEEVEHRPPLETLAELRAIEQEILQGIEALEDAAMNGASIPLAIGGGAMNTLVLRQVPDALYRRLKAVASAHRRSMNQEAILALEAGLPESPIPQRPTLAESTRWLEQQVWSLPVLDDRSAEQILGYGDDGLCG